MDVWAAVLDVGTGSGLLSPELAEASAMSLRLGSSRVLFCGSSLGSGEACLFRDISQIWSIENFMPAKKKISVKPMKVKKNPGKGVGVLGLIQGSDWVNPDLEQVLFG